jgi:hypothetical protein
MFAALFSRAGSNSSATDEKDDNGKGLLSSLPPLNILRMMRESSQLNIDGLQKKLKRVHERQRTNGNVDIAKWGFLLTAVDGDKTVSMYGPYLSP